MLHPTMVIKSHWLSGFGVLMGMVTLALVSVPFLDRDVPVTPVIQVEADQPTVVENATLDIKDAQRVAVTRTRSLLNLPGLNWQIGPLSPVETAVPDFAEVEESGLASVILQSGAEETPFAHSRVAVRMLGWTSDGKPIPGFESLAVEPVRFGLHQVVPGFSEAVQLMRVGERRRIWIPAELGYKNVAGRPAGTLIFDVELVAIE